MHRDARDQGTLPDAVAAQLLAAAPAYLLACDAAGRIVAFNEACETFLQRPAAAVLGRVAVDVLPVLAPESLLRFWVRYLAGGAHTGCVEVRVVGPADSPDEPRSLRCRLRTVAGPTGAPWVIVAAHDITSDRATLTSLQRRAVTDPLTGLMTRPALETALRTASDGPDGGHVLFVDVDGFKQVNDVYGHGVGDRVLSVLAGRLRATVRRDDVVSRIGGDEFVVLCPGTSRRAVADLVRRLKRAVGRPITIATGELRVTASIGTAAIRPGGDWRSTLADADRAMYAVKRAGVVGRSLARTAACEDTSRDGALPRSSW